MRLLVLAAEGIKNRDLWYPTILGVLVVVAAVSLFCGSVYLLLATNLGARLGFLVAAAGLSGFMVLLSCLWLTTASPLNTLKGRVPTWKAVESITGGDLSKSKIPQVRAITKAHEVKDPAEQANVKAAVDQVVVTPAGTPSSTAEARQRTSSPIYAGHRLPGPDLLRDRRRQHLQPVQGRPQRPVPGTPREPAQAELRGRQHLPRRPGSADRAVRRPAPHPEVRRRKPINSVVFERDLGSVRVPPFVALVASSILFTLCLLSLHWRERDLQEQAPHCRPKRTGPPAPPSNASPRRSRSLRCAAPPRSCESPASARSRRSCSSPAAARTGSWWTPVAMRGAGGLAFVLLAVSFWIFFGALFYMDRVRKRRTPPKSDPAPCTR